MSSPLDRRLLSLDRRLLTLDPRLLTPGHRLTTLGNRLEEPLLRRQPSLVSSSSPCQTASVPRTNAPRRRRHLRRRTACRETPVRRAGIPAAPIQAAAIRRARTRTLRLRQRRTRRRVLRDRRGRILPRALQPSARLRCQPRHRLDASKASRHLPRRTPNGRRDRRHRLPRLYHGVDRRRPRHRPGHDRAALTRAVRTVRARRARRAPLEPVRRCRTRRTVEGEDGRMADGGGRMAQSTNAREQPSAISLQP